MLIRFHASLLREVYQPTQIFFSVRIIYRATDALLPQLFLLCTISPPFFSNESTWHQNAKQFHALMTILA